jgi:hypothetical protein
MDLCLKLYQTSYIIFSIYLFYWLTKNYMYPRWQTGTLLSSLPTLTWPSISTDAMKSNEDSFDWGIAKTWKTKLAGHCACCYRNGCAPFADKGRRRCCHFNRKMGAQSPEEHQQLGLFLPPKACSEKMADFYDKQRD